MLECDSIDDLAIGEISRGPTESILCPTEHKTTNAVGKPMKVISGAKQVAGEAVFLDDIPPMANEAYFGPVLSTNANARILGIDWTAAEMLEGVIGHVDHNDVQGKC